MSAPAQPIALRGAPCRDCGHGGEVVVRWLDGRLEVMCARTAETYRAVHGGLEITDIPPPLHEDAERAP